MTHLGTNVTVNGQQVYSGPGFSNISSYASYSFPGGGVSVSPFGETAVQFPNGRVNLNSLGEGTVQFPGGEAVIDLTKGTTVTLNGQQIVSSAGFSTGDYTFSGGAGFGESFGRNGGAVSQWSGVC
ncbi:MAG: hypothetical protein HC936_01765 [Leptolyngbyaceae cyanobacterium SU_3_3]|nr:hypothetical protein [Leptolyngbyaceae cyanobacterium SU_3_3]